MGFKCGIVGLPNVGKSTLFNALTNSSKAQAENFPFCTIEPNLGVVPIVDERLDILSSISNSKKKIYTTISFVDIAGLVKGASKGEGLGNKFLSHIREVDAIIHMIRCFDSDDIQNVNANVDPVRDLETIQTEMKLADLESIQKRLDKKSKKNNSDEQIKVLETALDYINNDKNLDEIHKHYEKKEIEMSGLLSLKPNLYVCNVDEESVSNGNLYTKQFIEKYGRENTIIIFTGDNGTDSPIVSMMDNLAIEGGKGKTTDNGTHVPLIVNWKGVIKPNRISKALVDFSDFFPTLCEAAGIPLNSNWDFQALSKNDYFDFKHCFLCLFN